MATMTKEEYDDLLEVLQLDYNYSLEEAKKYIEEIQQ